MGNCDLFLLKQEYTSNFQSSNEIKFYTKEEHYYGTCRIMKRPLPDLVGVIIKRS